MGVISFVTELIGVPNGIAAEVILYTLCAYILLAVIEELFKVFHTVVKSFR